MKKESDASSLRDKIDHMVHSNELMVTMTIEAKKKRVGNEEVSRERGEVNLIKEEKLCKAAVEEADRLRKAAIEEKRAQAEETKALAKLIARRTKS